MTFSSGPDRECIASAERRSRSCRERLRGVQPLAPRGFVLLAMAVLFAALCTIISIWPGYACAQDALPRTLSPAGSTQVEFRADDGRTLNYMIIYPAVPDKAATPIKVFLSDNLHLYRDAPVAPGDAKRPLVVFSHGAGGNGSNYAWFGEYLASRGYFVALVYHYRAHTYDSSALYVRNRLWQRPRDISLDIRHILHDPPFAAHIDPDRIGVAGHSQGGFTALWLSGAEVNPELFLAFQRKWQNNEILPAYLRREMQPDAGSARNVRDTRVKAAFAMAPGDIQGFGMDAAGLRKIAIPAYLIVGERDTTTPPADNAAFAASHIPQAHLDILPGSVGHEIFTNECDRLGRDNFPEACVDAPGVNRARLHDYIGSVALRFFDTHLNVRRQP